MQVFGKEETFDPRTDPIVRVQARRLRAKLVRYYREEGRADETVIELPKGGYAPVFRQRDTPVLIKRSVAAALVSRNTVAVLPFADHSVERDLDYFCRGVREEIVHHLARFPSLRILAVGRTARDRREDRRRDDHQRQRPAVRRAAADDRATRSTVAPAAISGPNRWTRRSATSVRARRSGSLKPSPSGSSPNSATAARGSASRRPNENLAAHNLYLQGRYHLNQRTEEGLRKALDFFEKALVEDAEYALAHAGLADAYGLLAHYGVFGPAEVWTKAAVERGGGGDARRQLGGGAHVARAREGDAGLGLGRRRARVPARDQPRPALRDRAPLVRDVVPRAARPARRSAR